MVEILLRTQTFFLLFVLASINKIYVKYFLCAGLGDDIEKDKQGPCLQSLMIEETNRTKKLQQ